MSRRIGDPIHKRGESYYRSPFDHSPAVLDAIKIILTVKDAAELKYIRDYLTERIKVLRRRRLRDINQSERCRKKPKKAGYFSHDWGVTVSKGQILEICQRCGKIRLKCQSSDDVRAAINESVGEEGDKILTAREEAILDRFRSIEGSST